MFLILHECVLTGRVWVGETGTQQTPSRTAVGTTSPDGYACDVDLAVAFLRWRAKRNSALNVGQSRSRGPRQSASIFGEYVWPPSNN
jgi:hypothetical protein